MGENSDSENINSPEKESLCKYCQQKLNEKARVCYHCERHQKFFPQYGGSIFTFFMIVIAIYQAFMGWLQYDESKKKRIEAEEVLTNAKHVFSIASTNFNEMKIKASNVLQMAENNAQLAKEMTYKAEKEIIKTKSTFQDLAVTLTIPVTTSLALQGNLLVYYPLKYKIIQIDNVADSLKKLGVSEKDIDKAIDPFTSMISYNHMRRILYIY